MNFPNPAGAVSVGATSIFLILIACAQIPTTNSANILFYFGVSSYSHRIAVWPLVTSLADKGHNVTFVTIYHPKPEHQHPRVNEFLPKEFEDKLANLFTFPDVLKDRFENSLMTGVQSAMSLPKYGAAICKFFLETSATKNWIETSHFDLVIIDALYNECAFGLAHKFNSKVILFGTTAVFAWWHDTFGFPGETSWIPDLHVAFKFPLSFNQRVISTLLPLVQYFNRNWSYFPKLDVMFQENIDPSMPSVAELEREMTNLILLSSHFSEELSRSLPPFVVPVGGIHLENDRKNSNKAISPDIKKWMDESGPNGFIYISFGSMCQISTAPKEIQSIFFTAFKNTNTRFIWKWEADRPVEMPSNVLTAKWMPQQQIINHPKAKAFMTHAGLMGLTEAITAGVPVIMFPIFAEQDYNAFRFARENRGISLEISTLTLPQLELALKEILTNTKYKQNMMKTMKLYKDRPATPLQTALWWTDYVLRNDDLTPLKPLAMSQTWYERRVLDVWAFILVVIIVATILPLYVLKKVLGYLFLGGRTNNSTSNSKTNGATKAKTS